jgi:hypothetical protein
LEYRALRLFRKRLPFRNLAACVRIADIASYGVIFLVVACISIPIGCEAKSSGAWSRLADAYLSTPHLPLPIHATFPHPCILPIHPVGQGSDKVEKVYVFGGWPMKKSENLRLYHFAIGDKVYKTRPFLCVRQVGPPSRGGPGQYVQLCTRKNTNWHYQASLRHLGAARLAAPTVRVQMVSESRSRRIDRNIHAPKYLRSENGDLPSLPNDKIP